MQDDWKRITTTRLHTQICTISKPRIGLQFPMMWLNGLSGDPVDPIGDPHEETERMRERLEECFKQ